MNEELDSLADFEEGIAEIVELVMDGDSDSIEDNDECSYSSDSHS